jgi:hypothetical protein
MLIGYEKRVARQVNFMPLTHAHSDLEHVVSRRM